MGALMNYQKELDILLDNPENKGKRLFLQSCCAPCSSYVLEYLKQYFQITVFYYNPNITEEAEYRKRVKEQQRLIETYNKEKSGYEISYIEGDYETADFYKVAKGLEDCREGGARCKECFYLRLSQTAKRAKDENYDYFATTLTISPMKNADLINQIGVDIAQEIGIKWLPSDFKKKDGYKRSIQLSTEYDLYRQDYCGCVYSKIERDNRKNQGANEV